MTPPILNEKPTKLFAGVSGAMAPELHSSYCAATEGSRGAMGPASFNQGNETPGGEADKSYVSHTQKI
jgi:hypothetical protein